MNKISPRLVLAACVPALLAIALSARGAKWEFADRFNGYSLNNCFPDQQEFGPWMVEFTGYGCVAIESNQSAAWLHSAPLSSSNFETHASLVLGPAFSVPLKLKADLISVEQLRIGAAPNPWEVAWLVWNHIDEGHFYYLLLKPNGWEVGKKDPAYPGQQRFLATGTTPQFPIGSWYSVEIDQSPSNTITVTVNTRRLTSFVDTETPYTFGRLGLYTEDAHVHFRNIRISEF